MIHEQLRHLAVPIDSIKFDPKNARIHDDDNIKAIETSYRLYGQRKPIVVNRATRHVEAGNGQLAAALKLGWKEIAVVLVDDDASTAAGYAIMDNYAGTLAEWDEENLQELLGEVGEIEDVDIDLKNILDDLEESIELSEEDEAEKSKQTVQYTAKIAAPIYEPKGEQPSIEDLTDKTKTSQLCDEIQKADLADEVKAFLITAAQRHTVFNFRNIAEYYCHASPQVQHLMERSGLIIIDFNKAIKYGFVHLSERLGAIADLATVNESEDDDA